MIPPENNRKWLTEDERAEMASLPIRQTLGDIRSLVIRCVQQGWIKYADGTPLAADGGVRFVPTAIVPDKQ